MTTKEQHDCQRGTKGHTLARKDQLVLWSALQELLGTPSETLADRRKPATLEEIPLRKSRLDAPLLTSLKGMLGEYNVRTDARVRIQHTYGKSYRDLVRLRAGYVPNPPDAVVYPEDQGQIASLLSWASERDIVLIPFGGGSSLTGGVEPPSGDQPVLTINMANLSRVLRVDGDSLNARIQAGARGSAIEADINTRGFTLGYFPQSFKFSTLGGWLATRAHGHSIFQANGIDSISLAMKVVTPVGLIETDKSAATGCGLDLLQVLIGSEGSYGIITEALVHILPVPEVRDYRGILFPTFQDGIAACQDLMMSENLHPAAQLLDAAEIAAYATLSGRRHRSGNLLNMLANWYRNAHRRHNSADSSLLILGFEGQPDWTARQWATALDICRDRHGILTGRTTERIWEYAREFQPSARDTLLDYGIMMDTVRISTTWSSLSSVRNAVAGALRGAIRATGAEPSYIMMRLSSPSRSGTTLHATFFAKQIRDPDPLAQEAQWLTIRRAVREAILPQEATVLHDPVTRSTLTDLPRSQTDLKAHVYTSIKEALDPTGIMRPPASIA